MKRFIINTLLLLLPLMFWAVWVWFIDPFAYFSYNESDQKDYNTAFRLNALLYRGIQFKNQPSGYLLIGDSRTNLLPAKEIKNYTGQNYSRLNTNGAKMNEIIDMVYFADDFAELKHVVIGINFSMFNQYSYSDRFSGVEEIINNPLKYIYNKSVAEASFYQAKYLLNGELVNVTPEIDQDAFWKWNIETKAKHWYGKYAYPENLYQKLSSLDQYASDKRIKITLLVVPHHREFQDQINKYGLEKAYADFQNYLTTLNAEVIDYDFPSNLTLTKTNFVDPIHYNDSIGKIIAQEVFKGPVNIGKKVVRSE